MAAGLASTSSATTAANISDIVRETPSASVFVFAEDGVATLTETVPESGTKDLLASAARQMDNVQSVDSQLFVSEQLSLEPADPELDGAEFLPTGDSTENYDQQE